MPDPKPKYKAIYGAGGSNYKTLYGDTPKVHICANSCFGILSAYLYIGQPRIRHTCILATPRPRPKYKAIYGAGPPNYKAIYGDDPKVTLCANSCFGILYIQLALEPNLALGPNLGVNFGKFGGQFWGHFLPQNPGVSNGSEGSEGVQKVTQKCTLGCRVCINCITSIVSVHPGGPPGPPGLEI